MGSGNGGGGGGSGDTSTGGSGGGAECVVPKGGVPLSVPSDGFSPNKIFEVDGTFAPTADGFTVATATATDAVSISGVHPAIPQGTLVHMAYSATQGFYGPPGAFVRLDNLDVLDGQGNPTEGGGRLWYFATSGGGFTADSVPFAMTTEGACTKGTFETGTNEVEQLTLTGPGFSVTVAPGEQGTFTATSGEDAGVYVAKNVNVQFVGAMGGDAWSVTDFTIERGP